MLTVMTLNLNYYMDHHGAWPERRGLIHEAIASVQPDVVAFQAVRRELETGDGVDQAVQIARLLDGYNEVFFEPAEEHDDGTTQGSAIISRLPMANRAVHALNLRPGLEDRNPRVLQHVTLHTSHGALHLFNAHFSWVDEQARDNIEETLALAVPGDEFKLVVGDMNQPPHSPLFDTFRQAGFFDAWAVLRPDENGFTFEAGNPDKRIDYAWVSAALKPRLQDIDLVINSRDSDGIRMSDHYGLVVKFDLD